MAVFVCAACTYPSRNEAGCDNPACLENPTLSDAHKDSMRERAAAYAKQKAIDDARMKSRADLRKRGFTTAF
jgi:hypothetical protein